MKVISQDILPALKKVPWKQKITEQLFHIKSEWRDNNSHSESWLDPGLGVKGEGRITMKGVWRQLRKSEFGWY